MGYMSHPDMRTLIEKHGFSVISDFAGAQSRLSVETDDGQEIEEAEENVFIPATADADIVQEIKQRAEYVYPYKIPADARPKRVASDFEKKLFNEEYFAKSISAPFT